MEPLTTDDWQALNRLILALHHVGTPSGLEDFLLETLPPAVGADFSTWSLHSTEMKLIRLRNSQLHEAGVMALQPALDRTLPSHPLFPRYFDVSTGTITYLESVERMRDAIGEADFYGLPFYHEVARPLGIEDQLHMHLRIQDGIGIILVLHSGVRFSDRALLMASILRGHIIAKLHFVHDQESLHRRSAMEVVRPLRESLTEREFQVLVEVCKGHANMEIAHLLGISVKTIEKHLTRIFQKLRLPGRSHAISRFGPWISHQDWD